MRRWAWVAVLLPLVLSLGQPEPPTWTGLVEAVGHDPFTYLALTDDTGHRWRLQGDPVKQLWKQAQLRRVTVTGHIEVTMGTESIVVESWAWAPKEKP